MSHQKIMLKPHHSEDGRALIYFLRQHSDIMNGIDVCLNNKNIFFNTYTEEHSVRALILSVLIVSYNIDRGRFFIDGTEVTARSSWQSSGIDTNPVIIKIDGYADILQEGPLIDSAIATLTIVKRNFDAWRFPLNEDNHEYLIYLASTCVTADNMIDFHKIGGISNYFDKLYGDLDLKSYPEEFPGKLNKVLKSIVESSPQTIESMTDLILIFSNVVFMAELRSRLNLRDVAECDLNTHKSLIDLSLKKLEKYINTDINSLVNFINLSTYLDQLSNSNADGHWVPDATDKSTDTELFGLFIKWSFRKYPELLNSMLHKAELTTGGIEYYTLDELAVETKIMANAANMTVQIPNMNVEF